MDKVDASEISEVDLTDKLNEIFFKLSEMRSGDKDTREKLSNLLNHSENGVTGSQMLQGYLDGSLYASTEIDGKKKYVKLAPINSKIIAEKTNILIDEINTITGEVDSFYAPLSQEEIERINAEFDEARKEALEIGISRLPHKTEEGKVDEIKTDVHQEPYRDQEEISKSQKMIESARTLDGGNSGNKVIETIDSVGGISAMVFGKEGIVKVEPCYDDQVTGKFGLRLLYPDQEKFKKLFTQETGIEEIDFNDDRFVDFALSEIERQKNPGEKWNGISWTHDYSRSNDRLYDSMQDAVSAMWSPDVFIGLEEPKKSIAAEKNFDDVRDDEQGVKTPDLDKIENQLGEEIPKVGEVKETDTYDEKPSVTPKDIAQEDKTREITTTEINKAREFIKDLWSKLKGLFDRNDD